MAVKITINKRAVKVKLAGHWDNSVAVPLTEQVIKDSNVFCPEDRGTLMDSALTASEPQKGLAVWDTDYAKRRYYTGTPSKDVNPNASLMWCETAKNAYNKNWNNLAQKRWNG